MRIFQDLDDEDHHPDLSGSCADYSSGCDSSTEEFGIAASSPRSPDPSPAKKTKGGATSPASTATSGRSSKTSPRTVRFDLGAELTGDAALKKLTQTQVDLTAERTLRRRKEKTIVKLAKELNKRIVESEKKDKKIREVSCTWWACARKV
jgi:hypothetical protein